MDIAGDKSRATLSICVPLKNRTAIDVQYEGKVLHLELFANCARKLFEIIEPDDRWELVVADFRSDDVDVAQLLSDLSRNSDRPNLRIKHVCCEPPFNCGRGRNLAAQASSGELLFFMDADLTFAHRGTFDTAYRVVVELGKAYFPIIETYLDPAHAAHKPRPYGKGNVFMSRRHWEERKWIERNAWGREDDEMFDYFAAKGLAYRDQTQSLFHQWHPNDLAFKSRLLGK
jgi:glycosyltransferase involved in cell wall biosynthesis